MSTSGSGRWRVYTLMPDGKKQVLAAGEANTQPLQVMVHAAGQDVSFEWKADLGGWAPQSSRSVIDLDDPLRVRQVGDPADDNW